MKKLRYVLPLMLLCLSLVGCESHSEGFNDTKDLAEAYADAVDDFAKDAKKAANAAKVNSAAGESGNDKSFKMSKFVAAVKDGVASVLPSSKGKGSLVLTIESKQAAQKALEAYKASFSKYGAGFTAVEKTVLKAIVDSANTKFKTANATLVEASKSSGTENAESGESSVPVRKIAIIIIIGLVALIGLRFIIGVFHKILAAKPTLAVTKVAGRSASSGGKYVRSAKYNEVARYCAAQAIDTQEFINSCGGVEQAYYRIAK